MITMYDSVAASAIPAHAAAAAGYIDGDPRLRSFDAIAARFPRAHLLSITVEGGRADCLDIEPGNPVPATQAGAWVRSMHRAGFKRPCVYAPATLMPTVRASLGGLPRASYRLWVAEWDDRPDIPAGYDAHQWANQDPRGCDASVCLDDFFTSTSTSSPPAPVHHVPVPPKRRRRPVLSHGPNLHPKVTAAAAAGATVTALEAILQALGVHLHLTNVELGAIVTAIATLAGYLTPTTSTSTSTV